MPCNARAIVNSYVAGISRSGNSRDSDGASSASLERKHLFRYAQLIDSSLISSLRRHGTLKGQVRCGLIKH